MSEGPDLSETEAFAAEHALGVLTGAERAEAEARMARDPGFAAQAEAWRARLAPMAEAVAPVAPPAGVWSAVERALPANDDRRALRFWRGATAASLALAAASVAAALFFAGRPAVVIQPPAAAPILNASLMSLSSGKPMFVAAYDPARRALIVTSLAAPDPGHAHELWLIPADGRPHALGMVQPGTSKAMPMPGDMTPMLRPGAALAVSIEPPGGSPDRNAPSGPIAAMGKFSRI